MKTYYFDAHPAKKTYSLFKHLSDKGIKEITLSELSKYISATFGLSHQTEYNYRKSFFNLKFLKLARSEMGKEGHPTQIFKIDYGEIEKYFDMVSKIEKPSTDS